MTFLGNWTAAELKDLLTEKDGQMPALEAAWRDYDKVWMSWDPSADRAWIVDFNALKNRYAAARVDANRALALAEVNILPDNRVITQVEYQGVLSALQKQPGIVSPGDFQDLWDRLQNAMMLHALATGEKPQAIAAPPTWQPGRGSDADMNALQGAGNVISTLGLPTPAGMKQSPAKPGMGTAKILAIGGALTLGAIAAVKIGWKFVKPF